MNAPITQIDTTTWRTYLGDPDIPARPLIGSAQADFFPSINIHRPAWGFDEAFLNVSVAEDMNANPISTSAGDVLNFANNRIDWQHGDIDVFNYTLNNNVQETGVIYASKPADNVVLLRLTHPTDMVFAKQTFPSDDPSGHPSGAVDEDQIGRVRQSYAVYHSKYNNILKTGKLAHLFRWSVRDANGMMQWCTMHDLISLGPGLSLLVIELPGAFMTSASYPVIAMGEGDTLGYSTAGTSNYTVGDGASEWTGPNTISTEGTTDEMYFYGHRNSDGNVYACLGVANDAGGGGSPGTILVDTDELNIDITGDTPGPVQYGPFTCDSGETISTGTDFWVGAGIDRGTGQVKMRYDTGHTGFEYYTTGSDYTQGDASLNDQTDTGADGTGSRLSIWCTTIDAGAPSYTPRMGLLGVG